MTAVSNSDGIYIRILGDYGPFSAIGKSIGYQVAIGEANFLVDCGAPLFQQIGGHGLKGIKGLVVTHCHDDHKRWFTDLALFNMYADDVHHKVPLFTSSKVHEALVISSGPALETSLDRDSALVSDLCFEDYVDFTALGPRAKYRIVQKEIGRNLCSCFVIDQMGNSVGPETAKVVISSKNGKVRLLFRDPEYGEWIEPENFYAFSSPVFYEENQNIYNDPAGFTLSAIKAPVWHGLPGIGVKFQTGSETLIFSSDTVHDTELWKSLYKQKRHQKLTCSIEEFEESSILYGDINNFVERVWSKERFDEATAAFDNAIVIHDIATRRSVVHTDYRKLANTSLKKERTILTHSPDKMTSEWVLSESGKTYVVKGDAFFELVGRQLWPLNAAIYHKEAGRYYVGYRNPLGTETVYQKDDIINLGGPWKWEKGVELFNVDLYEDVGGRYFPKLADENSRYMERLDGRVELVEFSPEGSTGIVVEDQRGRLLMKNLP